MPQAGNVSFLSPGITSFGGDAADFINIETPLGQAVKCKTVVIFNMSPFQLSTQINGLDRQMAPWEVDKFESNLPIYTVTILGVQIPQNTPSNNGGAIFTDWYNPTEEQPAGAYPFVAQFSDPTTTPISASTHTSFAVTTASQALPGLGIFPVGRLTISNKSASNIWLAYGSVSTPATAVVGSGTWIPPNTVYTDMDVGLQTVAIIADVGTSVGVSTWTSQ